jgi:hypothetical protein
MITTRARSASAAPAASSPEDAPLPDTASGYGWLITVWVVVALFAAVTATRSLQVGIAIKDPGGAFLRGRLALSLGLFALLALGDAVARSWRDGHNVRSVAGELRRRWPRARLGLALSGLVAYYVVYACYHNLKSWDVLNHPRDGQLLSADAWLFFGHSPAVLLHDLLGQHVAAYLLTGVYESFGYLVTVSVVASLVFTRRIRDGYLFVVSGIWVWILGVASYYLIPSLGPFASAPRDFKGLPHTVITTDQAAYLAQRAHLLAHPHASDAFAQISAFASLHVGFTCMIVLMTRYYGLPRAARAMTCYLTLTVVATIYFGWHYAVDDLGGLLIGSMAVVLGRLMVQGGTRPRAADGGESSAGRAGAGRGD